MVKFGDIGSEVSYVQKVLSLIGYDLIVDGHFDKKTLRSLRAFQKLHNLTVDGIAGKNTIAVLKIEEKNKTLHHNTINTDIDYMDLYVNKNYTLPKEQYVANYTDKKQIFIHFTAGSPSAKNTISFWDYDTKKVATSFVIDGEDGTVYQAFNPHYWGWHLGIKGTKGKLDKISIGIEICSYGPLKQKNNKFYAWPKNWGVVVDSDNVYTLEKDFRGYKYFYAYSDKQLENLEKLLNVLVDYFNIKVQESFDESWFEYKPELIKNATEGIWTHVNVRKDKTDSYPDKRLIKILNRIAKKHRK